jgi:hypothetical protein
MAVGTGEREIVLIRWGLIPYWILLANSEGAPEVSENGFLQALRWTIFALSLISSAFPCTTVFLCRLGEIRD